MPTQLSGAAVTTLESLLLPAIEAMESGLDKAIDAVGEDVVAAYLVSYYRQKIYPIDIPIIPNVIEGMFDEGVCLAIPYGVKAVHKAIHREPPPTPAPVVVPSEPTGSQSPQ